MKNKKPKMTMAVVRLPEDYVNLAQRIAKTELRSYSSVLRRAIIEWLEEYAKRRAVMKVYSKKELNGNCPLCSSRKIQKGGISLGLRVGGNSNKLPEPNIERWYCDSCKKSFKVFIKS